MCGIVGAVSGTTAGTPPSVAVLDGLARLEYRGYDSAGVAVVSDGAVTVRKNRDYVTAPRRPQRLAAPLDAFSRRAQNAHFLDLLREGAVIEQEVES